MSDQETIPTGWDKPEAYFDLWDKHHIKPTTTSYLDRWANIHFERRCGCLVGVLALEVTGLPIEQLDHSWPPYKPLVDAGFPDEFIEGLDWGFTDGNLDRFDPNNSRIENQLFYRGLEIGVRVHDHIYHNAH